MGFIIGLFGGLLGLGGGWLIVPALNVMGVPAVISVGTSLGAMIAPSTLSASKHWRRGNILLRASLAISAASLVGVELGHSLLAWLHRQSVADSAVRTFYIGLLAFLSWQMFRKAQRLSRAAKAAPGTEAHAPRRRLPVVGPVLRLLDGRELPWYQIVAAGLCSGTLSGILGIGGGIVLVPILTTLFGFKVGQAVGTSLVVVLLGSILGTVTYAHGGNVEFACAGVIALGSLAGAYLGAHFSKYAAEESLTRLFALQAASTGVAVALRQVGFTQTSQVVLFGAAFVLGTTTLVSLVRNARREPEPEAAAAR